MFSREEEGSKGDADCCKSGCDDGKAENILR